MNVYIMTEEHKAEYCEWIKMLNDKEFVNEAAVHIRKSEEQIDTEYDYTSMEYTMSVACLNESIRRGKPELYGEAQDIAFKAYVIIN